MRGVRSLVYLPRMNLVLLSHPPPVYHTMEMNATQKNFKPWPIAHYLPQFTSADRCMTTSQQSDICQMDMLLVLYSVRT
jgi:hypothetical protein